MTVGVPGGIPANRNHLMNVTKAPYNADKTGRTDAQPAILKAITDAKNNDVVYPMLRSGNAADTALRP